MFGGVVVEVDWLIKRLTVGRGWSVSLIVAGDDSLNRSAIGAYSSNDDFNSETTACAESTIAELYNRGGDGCAVRLRTNSLSRLAHPRMPQRLLRKAGTAPHSCRVPRFQRMANYIDDRLADWNGRHAFPSTREAKGQMTPKRPRDLKPLAKSISL